MGAPMSFVTIRSCALALLSIIILFGSSLPVATAAPGEHSSAWGSMAGDPRVYEDGAACFSEIEAQARDGTACAVLYGHIFDLLNRVYINVQRPHPESEDLARGFPGVVGHEALFNFNELTLASTAGFVEYKDDGTNPRVHPEQGITSDVVIDTAVPITGYWYLSADFDEASGFDEFPEGSGSPNVGVLPCLTVRMTLETGRYHDAGDVLAVGETTKHVVSRGGGNETETGIPTTDCPGARPTDVAMLGDATEFKVDLVPVSNDLRIPRAKGFVIHVEWYQFAPDGPDEPTKVYMGQTNLRTGEDHLTRVLLPIANAVTIERVTPVAFDGKIYVQVVANSPWGSYDVDPGSIALKLRGADGTEIPMLNVEEPILRYSRDHGGHFEPVTAVFAWDHMLQNLPTGSYEIVASAMNWQHTATATEIGQLEIMGHDRVELRANTGEVTTAPSGITDKETAPGAPLALTLVLVAVLAFGARRRRTG